MAADSLSRVYAKSMKNHPFGYALYEPESSTVLKPGSCGYINRYGQWTPIINPTVSEDVETIGLSQLEGLTHHSDGNISWGPKVSQGVQQTVLETKAGVSLAAYGLPAGAKAAYKFASSDDYGAILMTNSPVVRKRIYPEAPIRQWVKSNGVALAKAHDDVKKHGLWVVTSTHATKEAAINAWHAKAREVIIGFETKVVNIGEAAPSGSWYKAHSDNAWLHYEASKDSDEMEVVFFGALHFKYRKIAVKGHEFKQLGSDKWGTPLRHGGTFEVEIDEETYEISCEQVGDQDAAEDDGDDSEDNGF